MGGSEYRHLLFAGARCWVTKDDIAAAVTHLDREVWLLRGLSAEPGRAAGSLLVA